MMKRLKYNRAQHAAEYAVLIAVVVGAVFTMKVYFQRGLQARYRGAVTKMNEELSQLKQGAVLVTQYEPYYIKSQQNAIRQESQDIKITSSLLEKGKTDITKQTNAITSGNQETLSGKYGD